MTDALKMRAYALVAFLVVLALALSLSACATAPPTRVETVEVKIPVAVQPITPAQVPAVPAPLGQAAANAAAGRRRRPGEGGEFRVAPRPMSSARSASSAPPGKSARRSDRLSGPAGQVAPASILRQRPSATPSRITPACAPRGTSTCSGASPARATARPTGCQRCSTRRERGQARLRLDLLQAPPGNRSEMQQRTGRSVERRGQLPADPERLKFIFGYDMLTGKSPTGSLWFNCQNGPNKDHRWAFRAITAISPQRSRTALSALSSAR
jgi:hypothetical protein